MYIQKSSQFFNIFIIWKGFRIKHQVSSYRPRNKMNEIIFKKIYYRAHKDDTNLHIRRNHCFLKKVFSQSNIFTADFI